MSSKLLQVKVRNLTKLTKLETTVTTNADGFEVATHTACGEEEGDAC